MFDRIVDFSIYWTWTCGNGRYILDLGLVGAGSRVEHCEMAGYLTAIALAQRIGAGEVVSAESTPG